MICGCSNESVKRSIEETNRPSLDTPAMNEDDLPIEDEASVDSEDSNISMEDLHIDERLDEDIAALITQFIAAVIHGDEEEAANSVYDHNRAILMPFHEDRLLYQSFTDVSIDHSRKLGQDFIEEYSLNVEEVIPLNLAFKSRSTDTPGSVNIIVGRDKHGWKIVRID